MAEHAQLTPAAHDVLCERQRQINVEGWSSEHDDGHYDGDLARAAASYTLTAAGYPAADVSRRFWPWRNFWKPKGAREDLVKAGALILAEIERLDREDARERMRDD